MSQNPLARFTGNNRSNHEVIPLGTASWGSFPAYMKPDYKSGDLWLSRLPNGEPAGYRDDRHVLLVSGTRAGKGASVIIPNLCEWPGSVVVIDPKGENAMVTARRRGRGSQWCHGMGQKVHLLDPFGEAKLPYDDFADLMASFNPLDLIREDRPDSVDDAARIAEALIVTGNGETAFFDDAAKGVLKALILHVASDAELPSAKRNLISVRWILQAGDDAMRQLMELNGESAIPSGMSLMFKRMRRSSAFNGVVAQAGAMLDELLEASPRTLMSILQTARTNTDFLDSPPLRACLQRSTFQLSDLKRGKVSLYLCLPQRYMETHFRWLRMVTTLILGEMERVRPAPAPEHPVLMVLDEFPALKRMKVIENAAAQIAGFGVKLMFVAQTLAQLKDIYQDNWETLVANAGVKMFFGNDDFFTREYVSKLIGEIEVSRWTSGASTSEGHSEHQSVGKNEGSSTSHSGSSSIGQSGMSWSFSDNYGQSYGRSYSQGVGTNQSNTSSRSEVLHKRFLVSPDEVGRLFGNRHDPRALVLISGLQPIALQRTMYFSDPHFTSLFGPHRDYPPPKTLCEHKLEAASRNDIKCPAEDELKALTEKIEREALLAEQERKLRIKRTLENFGKLGAAVFVLLLAVHFSLQIGIMPCEISDDAPFPAPTCDWQALVLLAQALGYK